MPTPLPPELVHDLAHSRAKVFRHDIVMEAIDLSLALDRHVLIYGLEGLFLLETHTASWRLPPSRAVWVTAGTEVVTTTVRPVRCVSLFFDDGFAPALAEDLRVFSVRPVVREMIRHASTWDPADATRAERFFRTLLDLCAEEIAQGTNPSLPKARTPELEAVLRFTRANLADPDLRLEEVARQGAMSPRTLMRKLQEEIHMTWGQYLQTARMQEAMACLARGMQVTETAFAVGYTSIPAFSTAFRRATDIAPSAYRSQF